MKPNSENKDWVRVRYNYGPKDVFGWADESLTREVHGVRFSAQPIRTEIYVRWDNTFPPGYINTRNIVRVR